MERSDETNNKKKKKENHRHRHSCWSQDHHLIWRTKVLVDADVCTLASLEHLTMRTKVGGARFGS